MLNTRTGPVLVLQEGGDLEAPLICIPGAGASVTVFLEFTEGLARRLPVYGLQPRGIAPAERPHESVEEAACYNLEALAPLGLPGPLHLLGHSHGGLVAFEMACRLFHAKCPVASLSLIDTEPFEGLDAHCERADPAWIRREFIRTLESTYATALPVAEKIIVAPDLKEYLRGLHRALVIMKCWSSTIDVELLCGPFATYAAARNSVYRSQAVYPDRLHLALACDPDPYEHTRPRPRELYARHWKRHALEVDAWYASGNHFSMLQRPHARALAQWWRRDVAAPKIRD